MKKIFVFPALIFLTSGSFLSYRQSSVAINTITVDTLPVMKPDTFQTYINALPAFLVDTLSDWQVFKKEANGKIDENEIRINSIKAGLVKSSKKIKIQYGATINDLAARNQDLQKRMNGFIEYGMEDLGGFKQNINRDIKSVNRSIEKIKL